MVGLPSYAPPLPWLDGPPYTAGGAAEHELWVASDVETAGWIEHVPVMTPQGSEQTTS